MRNLAKSVIFTNLSSSKPMSARNCSISSSSIGSGPIEHIIRLISCVLTVSFLWIRSCRTPNFSVFNRLKMYGEFVCGWFLVGRRRSVGNLLKSSNKFIGRIKLKVLLKFLNHWNEFKNFNSITFVYIKFVDQFIYPGIKRPKIIDPQTRSNIKRVKFSWSVDPLACLFYGYLMSQTRHHNSKFSLFKILHLSRTMSHGSVEDGHIPSVLSSEIVRTVPVW